LLLSLQIHRTLRRQLRNDSRARDARSPTCRRRHAHVRVVVGRRELRQGSCGGVRAAIEETDQEIKILRRVPAEHFKSARARLLFPAVGQRGCG